MELSSRILAESALLELFVTGSVRKAKMIWEKISYRFPSGWVQMRQIFKPPGTDEYVATLT